MPDTVSTRLVYPLCVEYDRGYSPGIIVGATLLKSTRTQSSYELQWHWIHYEKIKQKLNSNPVLKSRVASLNNGSKAFLSALLPDNTTRIQNNGTQVLYESCIIINWNAY